MPPDESEKVSEASLETEIYDLKAIIESIKEMGANTEAAETILGQAEKALVENNLEIAQTLFESASQTTKLVKQQYFIQASSILFSSLQRTILNLENVGSDVNFIKNLYNKAKQMFDSGQYDEAMDFVKSAEDMAKDLKADLPEGTILDEISGEVVTKADTSSEIDKSQEQMERVSKTLISVEKLLQEAIDSGYAVNEAEKMYSLAEDAFDYQDYKKAEEYALESEKNLQDILKPMHDDQLKKSTSVPEDNDTPSTSELREDLPTGDGFGPGLSTFSDGLPRGIIGDAPKTIDDGDPFESEEEKMSQALEIEKEATNILITADEKITAGKDAGLNMPMAERLLAIGESYFDRGDFDKVKEYADKAIKQVDEIVSRKGFKQQAKPLLDLEAEVGGIKQDDEAGEGEGEGDEDYEEEPEPKRESGKKTGTAGKLEKALEKIQHEILEVKDLGVDIGDAEDLLNGAFEKLDKGNFPGAKEHGITSKNKIKTVKKNFIKKKALELIKNAWKDIAMAENEGIDVTESNILLKDARNLIKNDKFEEAAKIAMNVIQLLKE